ncbi:S8 family serine peptidase [Clostridium butyricum]|jgi:subtilisin family serine protease|uniref:S8 family serine peptidase n=1 Tax=Clostridium butyricum TaxID=1492 RepID=UPI0003D59595|nr:MAG: Peptidase families S8 and S53 protein [Clostridium butyricum DORA_1]MDU1508994.1 S8 family serine peptidase [Clostridium butyricum]MDU4801410.1 S8 family serine peptidase [Clostridium butyricum]
MSLKQEIQILQNQQKDNIDALKKVFSDIILIDETISSKINSLLNSSFDSDSKSNIFDLLEVTSLYNKQINGQGIKVAVIDSNFKSIPGKLQYKNLYNPKGIVTESYGHGTKVCSLISGLDIGIAKGVELYACVTENKLSVEQMCTINTCMRWCIDNNMDIINLSLGYSDVLTDETYENAKKELISLCDEAYKKGIIIVCAAGNNGYIKDTNTISFPAYLDTTISIGSVNSQLDLSVFSSTGPSLDFVTLGENIDVYDESGGTIQESGTSLAAPIASSIIALLKQQCKTLSKDDIVNILKNNVYDMGILGKDIYFGYGFMKACTVPDEYLKDTETNFLYKNLNISSLHKIGIKGKGIKIAIIGYGCNQLEDLNIYKYINLTNDGESNWISAQNPVGDICTSLIASKTLGIAPESEVYILRNRLSNGILLTKIQSAALEWCLTNNVDIVFTDINTTPETLQKLSDKGVICVMPCYSNNYVPDSNKADKNALKVTYITPDNKFISQSSNKNYVPYQSEYVDCAAYGFGFEYRNSSGGISTNSQSEYPAAIWKTMFASYEVMGILALLKQQKPELNTAIKIREILSTLCNNLGNEKNNETGYGLLQGKILE